VWCQFFFLRAYLKFEVMSEDKVRIEKARSWISSVLEDYQEFLTDTSKNPFAGIPELTNSDGAPCHFSCDSQAWSSSGLIELVYDLNMIIS
jgi:glycogen debranching enzyme